MMKVQAKRPAIDELRQARLARFAATQPFSTPASPSRDMPEAVDAPSLFRMGFSDEAVGRALIVARGNARDALAILRSDTDKTVQENDSTVLANKDSAALHNQETNVQKAQKAEVAQAPDVAECSTALDENEQLQLAIRMSLEGAGASAQMASAKNAAGQSAPSRPSTAPNPMWSPPRYLPANGADALRVHGGQTLRLVEDIEVRDGGYSWQRGKAFLDTGNQHMTIVDPRFAARHAIYHDAPVGTFGGSQAERWTTLHGVVPGASSRAPVVTIALRLRGEEFVIQAAVSEMGGGHDLLLGVDVLGRMFASGFRIGSGSM